MDHFKSVSGAEREKQEQQALAGREAFERDLLSSTAKDDIVLAIRGAAIGGKVWLQSSIEHSGRFENADHVAALVDSGVAEVGDWAIREAVVRVRNRRGGRDRG